MRIILLLLVSMSFFAYRGYKADLLTLDEGTKDILFLSPDEGSTWKDISTGLPKDVVIRNIYVDDQHVYLIADGGMLYQGKIDKGKPMIWESKDFSENLMKGLIQGRDQAKQKSIHRIYNGAKGPYMGLWPFGLYQQSRVSSNWEPLMGLPGHGEIFINDLVETSKGDVYISSDAGIYVSHDHTKTWQQIYNSGRVGNLAVFEGILLANSFNGLIKSDDNGHSWKIVTEDMGGIYNLDISKQGIVAIKVGGSKKGYDMTPPMMQSTNGINWQKLDVSDQLINPTSVEQVDKDLIYCNHKLGISKSSDNGQTWQLIFSAQALKEPYVYRAKKVGKQVVVVKTFAGC